MYIKTLSMYLKYIPFLLKKCNKRKEGGLYPFHASSLSIQVCPRQGSCCPGPHSLTPECPLERDSWPFLSCPSSSLSHMMTDNWRWESLSCHLPQVSRIVTDCPGPWAASLDKDSCYFPSLPVTSLPESKSFTSLIFWSLISVSPA